MPKSNPAPDPGSFGEDSNSRSSSPADTPLLSPEDSHLRYLLTAYLFGDISEGGKHEVETHLATCGECRSELEILRTTLGVVAEVFDEEPEIPYSFEERRLARVLEARPMFQRMRLDKLSGVLPRVLPRVLPSLLQPRHARRWAAVLLLAIVLPFSLLLLWTNTGARREMASAPRTRAMLEGSSTVPISDYDAAQFEDASAVANVGVSGTGGGFKRFDEQGKVARVQGPGRDSLEQTIVPESQGRQFHVGTTLDSGTAIHHLQNNLSGFSIDGSLVDKSEATGTESLDLWVNGARQGATRLEAVAEWDGDDSIPGANADAFDKGRTASKEVVEKPSNRRGLERGLLPLDAIDGFTLGVVPNDTVVPDSHQGIDLDNLTNKNLNNEALSDALRPGKDASFASTRREGAAREAARDLRRLTADIERDLREKENDVTVRLEKSQSSADEMEQKLREDLEGLEDGLSAEIANLTRRNRIESNLRKRADDRLESLLAVRKERLSDAPTAETASGIAIGGIDRNTQLFDSENAESGSTRLPTRTNTPSQQDLAGAFAPNRQPNAASLGKVTTGLPPSRAAEAGRFWKESSAVPHLGARPSLEIAGGRMSTTAEKQVGLPPPFPAPKLALEPPMEGEEGGAYGTLDLGDEDEDLAELLEFNVPESRNVPEVHKVPEALNDPTASSRQPRSVVTRDQRESWAQPNPGVVSEVNPSTRYVPVGGGGGGAQETPILERIMALPDSRAAGQKFTGNINLLFDTRPNIGASLDSLAVPRFQAGVEFRPSATDGYYDSTGGARNEDATNGGVVAADPMAPALNGVTATFGTPVVGQSAPPLEAPAGSHPNVVVITEGDPIPTEGVFIIIPAEATDSDRSNRTVPAQRPAGDDNIERFSRRWAATASTPPVTYARGGRPALQHGQSHQQLFQQLQLFQEEPLRRAYTHYHAIDPQLTFEQFKKRPLPTPEPTVGDESLGREGFRERYGVNPFIDTEFDHFSTFAMDVDTASYTRTRGLLNAGQRPEPESVRVEEFVNAIPQDYPADPTTAFSVFCEGGPSPFGSDGVELLKVTVKARELADNERLPSVLTFVIDTSGSMILEERLGLVKQAMATLLSQLSDDDRVAVVAYGAQSYLALPHTPALDRTRILGALDSLEATGSTNVEAGLDLAYRIADESFQEKALNRVILCSDGVATRGARGAEAVLEKVKIYAQRGIYLSAVGFGRDRYNDAFMERLSGEGNGNYAFVDSVAAASAIFSDNLPSTLQVLAKDAKIQVDFDPAVVRRYRLLGYENRDIADKDFRNDKIDAGEVGPGSTVTALYEVVRHPNATGDLGRVHVRFHHAATLRVEELDFPLPPGVLATSLLETSDRFRVIAATAEFAELLRKSYWAQNGSYQQTLRLLATLHPSSMTEPVQELISLLTRAQEVEFPELVPQP